MVTKRKLRGMGSAVVLLVLVIGFHLTTPPQAYSTNGFPIVSPYAELSAAYWQWAVIEPSASNPLTDTTGNFAGRNQSGPVWFLGGSVIGPVTRTVSIPNDKSIFFPVVTIAWANGNEAAVGPPWNIAIDDELTGRTIIFDFINQTTNLVCKLNDVDIPFVRTQSPTFNIPLAPDNIFGVPAGDWDLSWADGYYALLSPLAVGNYTLHFAAADSYPQDVTYNITIVPVPGTLPLLGSGLLGLVRFRRKLKK